MNAQPARSYLGIGEVLAQLRADFPDISVSKIRFLEAEGLIEPARSPSGYRRFGAADVERLRYILTAQRDQYLPLRVIKEQLVPADRAAQAGRGAAAAPRGGQQPDRRPAMLSRRELAEAAGIDDSQLAELEAFGLVRRVGRHPESDIFLDDVTVSRRHAEFYRDGGRFTVRDVGSLNGTYVNRERIEETDLSSGDEVQVGKFRLVFLLGPRSATEHGGGAQVWG